MGVADRYIFSIISSSLQNDEHHRATEALFAAALADQSGAAWRTNVASQIRRRHAE